MMRGVSAAGGLDGVLTADDIIVFLGWFFANDNRANVAGANQSRAATRETLTAWAILNSPRGQAKKALASGIPSQNELVKEELHNQMVRMRDAFIRIDPRLEGCISRHMVGCTLKAGGMELTKEQLNDALVREGSQCTKGIATYRLPLPPHQP
jgi:hypothetical protein